MPGEGAGEGAGEGEGEGQGRRGVEGGGCGWWMMDDDDEVELGWDWDSSAVTSIRGGVPSQGSLHHWISIWAVTCKHGR